MSNIKTLRENAGISMAELSRKSGVPYRTINDSEYEKRKPRDVYQLKKIADALGCQIEDLIDWNKEEN